MHKQIQHPEKPMWHSNSTAKIDWENAQKRAISSISQTTLTLYCSAVQKLYCQNENGKMKWKIPKPSLSVYFPSLFHFRDWQPAWNHQTPLFVFIFKTKDKKHKQTNIPTLFLSLFSSFSFQGLDHFRVWRPPTRPTNPCFFLALKQTTKNHWILWGVCQETLETLPGTAANVSVISASYQNISKLVFGTQKCFETHKKQYWMTRNSFQVSPYR